MKPNKTFVIRHKETHELWKTGKGKSSWAQQRFAKTAWTNKHYRSSFDDQDVYEIVEVVDDLVVEAINLLIEVASGIESRECVNKKIQKFLDKIK